MLRNMGQQAHKTLKIVLTNTESPGETAKYVLLTDHKKNFLFNLVLQTDMSYS